MRVSTVKEQKMKKKGFDQIEEMEDAVEEGLSFERRSIKNSQVPTMKGIGNYTTKDLKKPDDSFTHSVNQSIASNF